MDCIKLGCLVYLSLIALTVFARMEPIESLYTHHLEFSVFRINCLNATTVLQDLIKVINESSSGSQYEVIVQRVVPVSRDQWSLDQFSSGFGFNETSDNSTQCHDYSQKCTIVISILASLCLLLFSALALSLIILKEKRASCFQKLFGRRGKKEAETLTVSDIDRILANSVAPTATNMESNGGTGVQVNMPRKSSLKPPTSLFPMPERDEIAPVDPSKVRRKSIVTFNETTEIRS